MNKNSGGQQWGQKGQGAPLDTFLKGLQLKNTMFMIHSFDFLG
jgi:hypothetical protein